MDFLPDLLRSIDEQTYKDFSVLVIDNASSDGVEAYVRTHHPHVTILRNTRNIGFSPAHNQGIRFVRERWQGEDLSDRYVLVTNPDVIMSPTYLERLMADVSEHKDVAAFGGKLLRAYHEHPEDESLHETMKSDRIDSTGVTARRARTFHERGAGELDRAQYDNDRDVFAISGALALYRMSALDDVRYQDEFFDHDFFAYKEDVDLCWRLRLLGWGVRYVPEAVAYHHRNMYGADKTGLIALIRNRRRKSLRRSYFSNRNHWNMLLKNELVWNALLAAPWMVTMELARFVYVLFFETKNIKSFFEAIARTPRMWRKRRETMKKRKASAADMRRWFV